MTIDECLKGFPEEAKAEIYAALMAGDRDRGAATIARYQDKARAQLKAQGLDMDSFVPEVGQHIKWSDILRQVFRVVEFDHGLTTIGSNGRPKAASSFVPYGYLTVESPILNQPIRLPIVHGDDYLLASSVFDDPDYNRIRKLGELLVTYAPKRTFLGGRSASFRHVLHYILCPSGTLKSYYDVGDGVHMAMPAPEKLFGKFRYFFWPGQLKVDFNENFDGVRTEERVDQGPSDQLAAPANHSDRPVALEFLKNLIQGLMICIAGFLSLVCLAALWEYRNGGHPIAILTVGAITFVLCRYIWRVNKASSAAHEQSSTP